MSNSVNRAALLAVLDAKSAALDLETRAVADCRARVAALKAEQTALNEALAPMDGAAESIAMMQAAMRWQRVVIEKLKVLDQQIAKADAALAKAEDALKTALAEKRAVERLLADACQDRNSRRSAGLLPATGS